jgi:hypothetical protein
MHLLSKILIFPEKREQKNIAKTNPIVARFVSKKGVINPIIFLLFRTILLPNLF